MIGYSLNMPLVISTQGEEGSFHHAAIADFFQQDKLTIISKSNFAEVVKELVAGRANRAVIAIENSLYGTINTVYDLLLQQNVTICGEVYLHIEQNLIGLADTNLDDIREVYSHPVALAQCEIFLDTKLPKAEKREHHDTAASVADIKKWNDPSKAAIASKAAAELHNMTILAKNIETNKQNYTRFIVLTLKSEDRNSIEGSKTSIILQTAEDTKPGALYRALGVFAQHNINLFSLHSRPIVGKAWHYMFYLDVGIGAQNPLFSSLLSELKQQGCNVTLLGSYHNSMK